MEIQQMSRPRKDEDTQVKELTASMVTKPVEEVDIEDMPLNTLGDYLRYNERARQLNKKLRIRRYEIKQCPIELHPHERVVISRNDKAHGPIAVLLSNDMIHFDKKLNPGETYDLPRCVVEHIAERGTPVWKWFSMGADGAKETRVSHYDPRFSVRTIYKS